MDKTNRGIGSDLQPTNELHELDFVQYTECFPRNLFDLDGDRDGFEALSMVVGLVDDDVVVSIAVASP